MPKVQIYKNFQGKTLTRRKISKADFTESHYLKDFQMPAHTHDVPYISVILQGGYREKVGRKLHERTPNTIVFHPTDEKHAVNFYHPTTRILRIEPDLKWIKQKETFLKMFADSVEFQNGSISWIATRLYNEYKKNDEFSSLAIQGLMMELLAEAGRFQTRQNNSDKIPEWLRKVKEILREEFNVKKSLEEIAREVDIHPVYLSREFRRHMNCTIGDFIRSLRIEKASQKITQTDKELAEIAGEVGFYDQSHFTNTFKRITGMTPAEYREASK